MCIGSIVFRRCYTLTLRKDNDPQAGAVDHDESVASHTPSFFPAEFEHIKKPEASTFVIPHVHSVPP